MFTTEEKRPTCCDGKISQIILNCSMDVPKLRIINPKKTVWTVMWAQFWVGGHWNIPTFTDELVYWFVETVFTRKDVVWFDGPVYGSFKAAQFTRKITRMTSEPGEANVVSIQVSNKLAWPEWLVQIYRKWENVKVVGECKVTALGVTCQLHYNNEWWGGAGVNGSVYFASPIFLASVS